MIVADVRERMRCGASRAFSSVSSSVLPTGHDSVPRPTVLPPVQSLDCVAVPREMDASDDGVAGPPPSCADDDSVPPIVRFKNRYRRSLQQEQCSEIARDWNHNETTKLLQQVKNNNCSPVEDHYCVEYVSSSTDALSLSERRSAAAEESRPCEKRTWSRITPEVDCSDPWMSASKISCRDVTLDSSTRADVYNQSEQPKSNMLPKRYQEMPSSEYQNYIIEYKEPKCEPDLFVVVAVFFLQIFIVSFAFAGLCSIHQKKEFSH